MTSNPEIGEVGKVLARVQPLLDAVLKMRAQHEEVLRARIARRRALYDALDSLTTTNSVRVTISDGVNTFSIAENDADTYSGYESWDNIGPMPPSEGEIESDRKFGVMLDRLIEGDPQIIIQVTSEFDDDYEK